MKTKSGYTCEVDPEVLNDMELVDAIADLEGNPLAISKICRKLLHKEDIARLYDHVRTESGRVPMEAVTDEITEILKDLGEEGKK